MKKGDRLLDVTKIENVTQDIISSYGNNPKSNFLRDTSMDNISQENQNSNPQNGSSSIKSDEDYLSAVNSGDMEAAQRMVDEAAKGKASVKDGEKYSYDELIKKAPIKIVDVPLKDVPTTRKTVNLTKMREPAKVGADVLQGRNFTQTYVYNPNLGMNVLINRDGINHGIKGNKTSSSTMNTAEVTYALPEILRNSVAVNELIPRAGDDATASYVLFGYARRSDGKEYIVHSTVYQRGYDMAVADSIEILGVLKGIKAKK